MWAGDGGWGLGIGRERPAGGRVLGGVFIIILPVHNTKVIGVVNVLWVGLAEEKDIGGLLALFNLGPFLGLLLLEVIAHRALLGNAQVVIPSGGIPAAGLGWGGLRDGAAAEDTATTSGKGRCGSSCGSCRSGCGSSSGDGVWCWFLWDGVDGAVVIGDDDGFAGLDCEPSIAALIWCGRIHWGFQPANFPSIIRCIDNKCTEGLDIRTAQTTLDELLGASLTSGDMSTW